MKTLLGMFAKHWEPGRVKTRLAETVGFQEAAELYRLFVELLSDRFQTLADDREVCFAPADRRAEMRQLVDHAWSLHPQVDGDLGSRISDFFQRHTTTHEAVALIGSDSPTLPQSYVEEALAALAKADVVLGPSEDGGYYLIGMTRPTTELFRDIAWSTEHVFQQTVQRANFLGLDLHTLPVWYDIDRATDLERLDNDLQNLHDSQNLDELHRPAEATIKLLRLIARLRSNSQ